MALGVLKALFAGALSPDPRGRSRRRRDATDPRSLSLAVARRPRLAASGRRAPSRPAPCRRRSTAKLAPGKAAACPARRSRRGRSRASVEPPAVTVVPAVRREFVDRLFVSGTLVAREEAQVAARIDGLTIVEVDAEDGDRVKAGPGARPARPHPARRDAWRERRGDQARRRGDRSGAEPDRAVAGAGAIRHRRFRPRAQARGGRHGRFDHRAARDGDEDGAGATGRRPERARRRRSRPQEPRRGAAGAAQCASTARR